MDVRRRCTTFHRFNQLAGYNRFYASSKNDGVNNYPNSNSQSSLKTSAINISGNDYSKTNANKSNTSMNVSSFTNATNANNSETIRSLLTTKGLQPKNTSPPSESIPKLSYGLERCLFNSGVHWLRDLRTNVFNFDPFLKELPSVDQFNFDHIPSFIPASGDTVLQKKALKEGCSYVTSTSSISQSMAAIYFVLGKMRLLNLDCLSQSFADEPRTFTLLTRSPSSVLLQPHGPNIRSIVLDKAPEAESVLSLLGQVMERLLTESKEKFLCMLQSNKNTRPPTDAANVVRDSEPYAYTTVGKILMRSQIDCHDPRLPKRTFDLKTRAVLPIRMDVQNPQKYRDYRLITNQGLYCSFEREYYDMCRSALLKYNFQVRIGDMDGIFVAYHNTHETFGFQYISKEEMDERIYGNSLTGDATFNFIMQIYNSILDSIVPLYPSMNTVRLTFVPDKAGLKLTVFAEDCGAANEGNNGNKTGSNIRQFTITLNSLLNGFRTEQILLNPNGSDEWTVNFALTQTKANIDEYDAVRSKVVATKSILVDNDSGTSYLKTLNSNIRNHRMTFGLGNDIGKSSTTLNEQSADLIAPWTIL